MIVFLPKPLSHTVTSDGCIGRPEPKSVMLDAVLDSGTVRVLRRNWKRQGRNLVGEARQLWPDVVFPETLRTLADLACVPSWLFRSGHMGEIGAIRRHRIERVLEKHGYAFINNDLPSLPAPRQKEPPDGIYKG